ncbi:MAG: GNAT family N-acetyltransferase [Hyphomicrobiaceae bacterium]|nr:GNAT family N-acetyltransferase [Hyphomicrobiaceae bacterium]
MNTRNMAAFATHGAALGTAQSAASCDTRSNLRVEVLCDYKAAEAVWRDLETRSDTTVYQRYDWARIWYETLAPVEGASPFIVIGHIGHQPAFLLALSSMRRKGSKVVRFIGGKHANICLPLVAEDRIAQIDTQTLKDALLQAGRTEGVDLYHIGHQPYRHADRDNPFAAFDKVVETAPYFETPLSADFEAFSREKRGRDGLKKLRYKRKKLQELGNLVTKRPETFEEMEQVVETFLEQKAGRMQDGYHRNAFEDEGAADFLRVLARESFENGSNLLDFHALWLGDTIIATFAGGLGNRQYSCSVNSIALDEEVMRHSPGDIILADVLKDLCEDGLERFDLGVGEAIYKRKWCEARTMFETFYALTPKGAAVGALMRSRSVIREWLKTYPPLFRLAHRVLNLVS